MARSAILRMPRSPERLEEWGASRRILSSRTGLSTRGWSRRHRTGGPARYSRDRKASSQRSQFGRLVELSRGAANALLIWTAAFGIKRAICRVDSFKALSGFRNGASNGEIIRLALDHERISAGRKHEVFLLWPYCSHFRAFAQRRNSDIVRHIANG